VFQHSVFSWGFRLLWLHQDVLVFRRPRTGPLGQRKPSLNHPNSTVFYSTRTPIPHPTTANQAGTSPSQHQLNSQSKPRETSYRTRNHKKNLHHTPQARVIFNSEVGRNNHFRTDNCGSVALGIYYFTTGGQDTQHPHRLRTKDFYHASILTNNNKISFILVNITIYPSITSLPSLPSKPSKSGFLHKNIQC
jgi:hypothetical protein